MLSVSSVVSELPRKGQSRRLAFQLCVGSVGPRGFVLVKSTARAMEHGLSLNGAMSRSLASSQRTAVGRGVVNAEILKAEMGLAAGSDGRAYGV